MGYMGTRGMVSWLNRRKNQIEMFITVVTRRSWKAIGVGNRQMQWVGSPGCGLGAPQASVGSAARGKMGSSVVLGKACRCTRVVYAWVGGGRQSAPRHPVEVRD